MDTRRLLKNPLLGSKASWQAEDFLGKSQLLYASLPWPRGFSTVSYLSSAAKYARGRELKDKEYFVLGDNRANPFDAHLRGALPLQNIIGRVEMVYCPLNRSGKLPDIHYGP